MAVNILGLSDINLDNIITAIEGILTDLGYELEDFSNIDIGSWTGDPVVFLNYEGEIFQDFNGRQKNESVVSFSVPINFRETTPVSSRQKSALVIANLKENITPDQINDPAKLVIAVYNQESRAVSYEADVTTLNYTFDVRYRNED